MSTENKNLCRYCETVCRARDKNLKELANILVPPTTNIYVSLPTPPNRTIITIVVANSPCHHRNHQQTPHIHPFQCDIRKNPTLIPLSLTFLRQNLHYSVWRLCRNYLCLFAIYSTLKQPELHNVDTISPLRQPTPLLFTTSYANVLIKLKDNPQPHDSTLSPLISSPAS